MSEILQHFFTTNFIPHGHCYLWQSKLISLHLISDALIAIAYYSIPLTIFYFAQKRQDLPFNSVFLLFGAFIVACGTSHLMAVWTLWYPVYWLSGTIKAITAIVSVYTAITLVKLIPQVLSLPSPAQLEAANQELQRQIIERQQIAEALGRAHDELEVRVQERTVDLATANHALQAEIIERQRAEDALREMSKALESAVEGISQLDSLSRYIKVNPAYASMLGYQAEELIGRGWENTIHPEDLDRMVVAYQQMLTDGKAEIEVKATRKDGSIFDKQVVMVKTYNPQQEFIGHYCFMKDISDRRDIERLKDEFVSVVSHELRTPLTSISGALDLLASGILQTQPEDAQRMLNIAANNTDRLVRLINDILDIERIESGKIQMTKQICDAADLMLQSAEVVEEMAQLAEVRLSISPLSARIWADSDRIIQVLTNLLSNAIKFSIPGSTVWLSAEILGSKDKLGSKGKEDRENNPANVTLCSPLFSNSPPLSIILFKIQDQGRGIPSNKLESIFERFQQVDASDSRQKGGTGLGLAICRSILQHHNGQIWAESSLGMGSTFFFTLPMLPESPTEIVNVHDSCAPLILECDDDPDIRSVVQAILQRQGYRVISAASGREAVEMAVQQHPAVILLNLMMPGMDGWETLAALKQQIDTQNIPIIILSGLFPDLSQGLPVGVSDWIVKPPNLQLLFQALEKALVKNNQGLRVLVVEDDRDLAQVLIAMFNRHEIETFHAQTGHEALLISQNIIPDLLVLDLGLPECDGFAVVDWLRQHNSLCRVPLVVYTAQDLDESERQRLKLGQTIYLTKGRISPQEFEQRVINLLNRMIRE